MLSCAGWKKALMKYIGRLLLSNAKPSKCEILVTCCSSASVFVGYDSLKLLNAAFKP